MSDQALFARALLDPQLDEPSGLRVWNGSNPAKRFAVYRNNVVVSLIDALAGTFPVTQSLVGEEFFRAMAQVFIQTNPVRSRVLVWMGAPFPAFLEGFPPAASLPYLADVARLEMLRVQAYHAADAQAIELQALGQLLAAPDALSGLQLALHPCAHVLQSDYAVYSLWAAHQGLLPIETVNPELPQTVLVFRRNLDVEMVQLRVAQGVFLMQLMQGASLACAVEVAAQHDADFDPSDSLAMLIRLQLITGIHHGDIPP